MTRSLELTTAMASWRKGERPQHGELCSRKSLIQKVSRPITGPDPLPEGILARFRLLVLGFLLSAASAAHAAPAATLSLLDGETVVPAGSYVAWRVPAAEAPGQSGVLVGKLSAQGGAQSRFAVAVLSESDFASWKKGYRAYPLYSARRVAHIELRTRLPRPDVYYVVVSNTLSPPHASTIHGTLRLFWVPASNAVASAAGALAPRDAVRRDLFSLGLVLLLAGALALWSIHEARGEKAALPVAEERAA